MGDKFNNGWFYKGASSHAVCLSLFLVIYEIFKEAGL